MNAKLKIMEKATFRSLCLGFLLTSTSVFSQGGSDFLGQVLYHYNYPISGVNAYLHNPSGTIIDTDVTDVNGYYEFENVTAGTYTITFSTSQPEGGIELDDAFLVMLHLLNLYPFTPIQSLAADVNGSGTITWLDYTMILIGYLNQGNPFPIGPWVFESLTTPIPVQTRDGVKTGGGSSSGDVNGSLVPDPKSSPVFIENPVFNVTADPTSPIEFSIKGGQNLQIAGMHLSITVPESLELTSVEPVMPSASIFISGNHVNITWIDDTRQGISLDKGTALVEIHVKSTGQTNDGASYSLKLGDQSHFINANGEVIQGVSLILPTIDLTFENNLTAEAFPNPFFSDFTINYTTNRDGNVTIVLYDHSGRQVRELENGFSPAGSHQLKINGQSLLPGIYHYNIRLSGNQQIVNSGTIIKSK
jgi:hypothetical protein